MFRCVGEKARVEYLDWVHLTVVAADSRRFFCGAAAGKSPGLVRSLRCVVCEDNMTT